MSLGKETSTYRRLTEKLSSKSIDQTPLQRTWSKRIQTNMKRVASTAASWRSLGDKIQKNLQENDTEDTPSTREMFKDLEQWLLQLLAEKKISSASLHREVKK